MLDKERSREVRSKIRAVLLAEWDPIGINDVPEAADEYDSYIGCVYDLLGQGAAEESIRDYLRQIEVDQMEMVNASREPLLPDANRNRAAASLTSLGRYVR